MGHPDGFVYQRPSAICRVPILQRRQPPAVTASPPMQIPVVRIQSEEEEGDQWVGSLPTPPAGPPPQTTQAAAAAPAPGATASAEATTANDEMTRKMAVMKIKMGSIHIHMTTTKTFFTCPPK